ncbi:acyltransferase family protein [Leifsonia sp. Le1]|uniref:acyltransferase family protein n=1 Tax=Leifsonia sp. Le1 TaxID=3404918 RepID=UPI003EBBD651
MQALRFVAAALVVLAHATYYTSERLDPSMRVWYEGGLGVMLFFGISGFVMLLTADGRGGRDWADFALRRVIRIAPLYWIVTTIKLITLVAVPSLVLHAALRWDTTVLSYAFLPSRNIDGDVQPLFAVGWTLIFEMAFYLLVSVAIALRVDPIRFCGIVLSLVSLGNILRGPDWPAWAFYFDPIVLFFLAGMVLARWTIRRNTRSALLWGAWIVALWTLIEFVGPYASGNAVSVITWVAIVGILLVAVLFEDRISPFIPRWLTWLGDASYSLYLTHPLIAPAVPAALAIVGLTGARFGWVSVTLALGVAVVASCVCYLIVERPTTRGLNGLRKRWATRKHGAHAR